MQLSTYCVFHYNTTECIEKVVLIFGAILEKNSTVMPAKNGKEQVRKTACRVIMEHTYDTTLDQPVTMAK